MKLVRLFIVLSLIGALFALAPKSVTAEAYPSYVSGITMANLSSATANVVVTYYRGGTGADAGTVADTIPTTIAPNGVKDYAAVPVAAGFRGSVVISSDQPLAAISTMTGSGIARGSYVGVGDGTTSILLPFLAKNHGASSWSTFVAVQNIGTADTTVTVDYASCPGTSDATAVIKASASVTFDQKTSCMPNGFTSAVITSTGQPLAAVVAQESTVVNSMLVSNGFSNGSAMLAIPLVNSNNPTVTGWRTAITIMNNGTLDTTVKLTYKRTDGTSCSETQTIAAKTSKVFAGRTLQLGPAAGVTSDCGIGVKLIGAAYIAAPGDNSAGQPLVALVNQDRGSLASAYDGFDPAKGTPRITMPLIMDNNGASQWATSFNVMNAGTSTTFVKCTFVGSSYVATSGPSGLAVNGVFEDLQRSKLGGVKISSAVCTAYTSAAYTTIDTTAKIVGVVNERGLIGSGDLLLSYEGMNSVP